MRRPFTQQNQFIDDGITFLEGKYDILTLKNIKTRFQQLTVCSQLCTAKVTNLLKKVTFSLRPPARGSGAVEAPVDAVDDRVESWGHK